MEFIKKYFANKNAIFYAALGVAAASLIVAVAYGATWIEGSESVGTLVLMIIGALAFAGISCFSPRLGATAMAVCNLTGLALFINSTYLFIFNKAISGLNFGDPDIVKVIVFAVFMVLLFAASNVFVWLGMTKKDVNSAASDKGEKE